MQRLYALALLSWCSAQVQAKAVFAHFMVGNSADFSDKEWKNDIQLAQNAHIDGFALNMAHNEIIPASLDKAFEQADELDFKLFFSFDYAGNGSWPKKDTIDLMNKYKDHPAYYKYNSKPFMSTFEGATSNDWPEIKNQTGAFFMPDFSSIGPQAAANKSYVDGLFSWAAWPNGPTRMNTSADDAYKHALNGRPYMMPVSPWFYTNMPGFDKNWVWASDNLWYDRWEEVISFQPEFVQIISWNDFGESHYIGPLHDDNANYESFSRGEAPFNYAKNMPHDGWRTFLPYVVDQYKSPNSTILIKEENVVTWYRLHPVSACTTGGTTGNSETQGQVEYKPSEIVHDRIMYSALLNSTADITVSIGKTKVTGTWDNVPKGGKGVYHGSVPFTNSGKVKVSISRGDKEIASVSGEHITSECPSKDKGFQNYNAWVGTSGADGLTPLSNVMCLLPLGMVIFTLAREMIML
ncbi:glycoside hydrolase [Aspergillus bertholletiae]|uniref:Glycoside hydrolase n=1 Tax=Aspergillus bertholletiae TaxID=1226010 RepID=A0A5N7BCY6_9EURO|nr:glycoside hydrolase [Aspergillus bertholletiae]